MGTVPPLPVHLYQIAYSPQTLAAVEPGYLTLDNLDNPRPDWYEYWPIRRFLLNQPLDETAFYGFFSPKFGAKTNLTHAQVTAQVQAHGASADVLLFSPQPDMGAFFINVFEQGGIAHANLMDAMLSYLDHIGRPLPLPTLVMDSRQIVFSNYFAARPDFWREWLAWTEPLFALCEGPASPLQQTLTRQVAYNHGDAVACKVFLIERMASLLLCVQPRWRSRAANPFNARWTDFAKYRHQIIMCDALKMAFREQGYREFIRAFSQVRADIASGMIRDKETAAQLSP